MNTTKILLQILFCCAVFPAFGQKTVETEEQLWFAFFNQTRVSEKWGAWVDLHLRLRDNYAEDFAQGIARVGLTYFLNDDVRLTAAYGYVHHFPGEGHRNIGRPEHRPWQQIQWFTRFPKAKLMQYIRLEQRFRRKILNDDALAEGYIFNHRVRYNATLLLPLTKKGFAPGSLQFLLNDELFINFGENIVFNYFDQNRLFGGLVYQITDHSSIQAGYMNVFQQLPVGNVFRNQHTIRFNYVHNLDLR